RKALDALTGELSKITPNKDLQKLLDRTADIKKELDAVDAKIQAAAKAGDKAALEDAGKEAEKLSKELSELDRRRVLGTDPTRGAPGTAGEFLAHEAEAASHIEQQFGNKLERIDPKRPDHATLAGDWVDPVTRRTFDAVGPHPFPAALKSEKGIKAFEESIRAHALKDVDVIFVDLTGMDATVASRIRTFVANLLKTGPRLAREIRLFP